MLPAGAGDAVGIDVTLGIVGTTVLDPTLPTMGETPSVGTAAAELTPRLPISVDPKGMPVRAAPPGVIGVVDAGVDDDAMLPEPEPHMPDMPAVSIPEVADIPDDADAADEIGISDVAAVAGAALPAAIPPPSKLDVDPNIPAGAVPEVAQVVPSPGIEIEPVTLVEAGLTPGDTISVEPIGIPVGPTVMPELIPSGEVAPIEGAAVTVPTWANARLHSNAEATAITRTRGFMAISLVVSRAIGSRCEPVGWRHEFRSHRILDGARENLVDLRHLRRADMPSHDVADR